jgi:hypothetical protein
VEPDDDEPFAHWARLIMTVACVLYYVVLRNHYR